MIQYYNMKYAVLIFIVLALSFAAVPVAEAQINLNLDYPEFFGVNLDTKEGQDLGNIIAWFYAFIVIISGLAAFAVIVYGGVRWMTSAGSPGLVGDAKDRIQKALLGLLLILSSFIILQTINPELGSLRIPGLDPIGEGGVGVPEEPIASGAFLANGQPNSLLVSPDEQVLLQWNIAGVRNKICESSGGSWGTESRTASPTQSVNLGTLEEGEYDYDLFCRINNALQSFSVRVIVSSEEVTDDSTPSIESFTVNGSSGPNYTTKILELSFAWQAENVDRCIGEGSLVVPFGQQNPSGQTRQHFPGGTGQEQAYYVLVCLNDANGRSASETITVKLLE